MGILGGEGFSLPVVSETEVVDVKLNFTDKAIQALKNNMNGDEDTHVLVISAQSGGCSGYLYDMKIIEQPDEKGFQKIKIDEINIFVHNKDSSMLNGIQVDFKETLMGGGFQIENPNADRACGCGQSFG
ncbi:MAG: iron-sulfur cluster assembly accessory protein [Euryarchaeota archaeon]|jgi:iron-sulfur cluster assembly protein|nr:iron-sulfur cluster assembly accessory protein [Euryarchaeota archaeon]|tara:strand:+ start:650 stop:1036 length:387 start_codon:yes stop_codon:yes gene_type:complete